MSYSTPQIFQNEIAAQFVAEEAKTEKDVQKEIAELIPFLKPVPQPPAQLEYTTQPFWDYSGEPFGEVTVPTPFDEKR